MASLVGYVLEQRATKPGIHRHRAQPQRPHPLLVGHGAWSSAARSRSADTTTIVLFAILSFMALREFWTLTPSRRGDHQRAVPVLLRRAAHTTTILLGTDWYGMFVIFIPVYAFLLLPAVATLTGDTNDFLARSAKVQWGLMLTVYSISHAPALLMLDTGVPARAAHRLSDHRRAAQRRASSMSGAS